MSKAAEGILKSRDGTAIYFERHGQGPPLVLCYGLTCRISHWRHQIEAFSKQFELIGIDYRGHHRSGRPENDQHLKLKWCAHDVEDAIRHLGLEKAVVMGHSFGVPVALEVARALPDVVKATVLVCGSVVKPFSHMFRSNKMDGLFKLTSFLYEFAPDPVARGWHYFTKRNWFSYLLTARFGFNAALSSEEDILGYLRGVHEAPFETFHNLLQDYNAYDGRPALRETQCPSLVIAGGADHITPLYLQEEMARLLPEGQLHTIEQGSHNTHMDFPKEVNKEIEQFLAKNNYA